jgi:hypothetical protein
MVVRELEAKMHAVIGASFPSEQFIARLIRVNWFLPLGRVTIPTILRCIGGAYSLWITSLRPAAVSTPAARLQCCQHNLNNRTRNLGQPWEAVSGPGFRCLTCA